MSPTAIELTEKDLVQYRLAARARHEQEQEQLERLREHAWQMAREATKLLKRKFGAERVVVFGSLTHRECFTPWSDLDIAAWGIPAGKTFQAMGEVMELGSKIEVNLVDMAICKPRLKKFIEEEGIPL